MALHKKAEALWERAEEALSPEDTRRLWELYRGIISEEGLSCFREGFRLGASLMLELVRD